MKDSIVFYLSQYESIKSLTDEQLGKVYRALFEKQLGNEIDLPIELIPIFNLLKNQMVLDNKKYEDICQKNRENGKKGGRPRKDKDNTAKTEKANGFFENPNDNENDNDNDNENDNDNDNEVCI